MRRQGRQPGADLQPPPTERRGRRRPALIGLVVLAMLTAAAGVGTTLMSGLDGSYRANDMDKVVSTRVGTSPDSLGLPCVELPVAFAASLPQVPVLSGSAVQLIDPRACEVLTLLQSGASGPIRQSADQQWIGFGGAQVVDRAGGAVISPLGLSIWQHGDRPTWAWSPAGATLAGVTVQGGVVISSPGSTVRQLLPDGWGATELGWAGPDRLIVARGNSLWQIETATVAATEVYHSSSTTGSLGIAQVSEDWVIFWRPPFTSASAADDGVPLVALSLPSRKTTVLAPSVIMNPAAVAPCGYGIAVMVGPRRFTTTDKTISVFTPDDWARAQVLGRGVFPRCSLSGRYVTFSQGPAGRPIGLEQRRVVVYSFDHTPAREVFRGRLPRSGVSDESPFVSGEENAVMFVRTSRARGAVSGQGTPSFAGVLYVARIGRGSPASPIALARMGETANYYGSFGWPDQLAVW